MIPGSRPQTPGRDTPDFASQMQRVEALVRDIETWPDPDGQTKAVELVQSLMQIHGAAVERMMDIVAESSVTGRAVFEDFARDGLVGSLLLLYGLHPVELETRIVQAVDRVRPLVSSQGGSVELFGVSDGVVRIKLQGSDKGCPSTTGKLKLAIEEAIYEAAPDVTAIEFEEEAAPQVPPGLVQIRRSASYG